MTSAEPARHNRLRRLLAGGVALYLCIVAGLAVIDWLFNRMTFYPTPGIDFDPAQISMPVSQVTIRSGAGTDLHAFHLRTGADRTIVFFHGNAGNASHRLPAAERLALMGPNVLLVDYRGYGLSEGRPTEQGIYQDGEAAWQWLVDSGQDPEKIILFGRSLGAVVAVRLASQRTVERLVLVTPLTSASDMAREIGMGWAAWAVRGRLDALAWIRQVQAPVLVVHGDQDEIVPLALGRRLHAAAPAAAELVVIAGGRHNDLSVVGGERYWQRIEAFVRAGAH